MREKILLIDDEASIVTTLSDELTAAGYEVDAAHQIKSGVALLQSNDYVCVITDIRLPDGDGIDLLKTIKREYPDTQVIVITGYGTVESAVSAMKTGAFDYVVKPFYNEEIVCILDRIKELYQLRTENRRLKEEMERRTGFHRVVGKNKTMREIFSLVETVAKSDANVLILGESGTGKELVADAIHTLSPRSGHPFVKMNCEVFTPSLLEDELFGHEKGAYTGAINRKPGRFEMANGGTLFLDDVDDLDPQTQLKLLRVLQEREFERIGGTQTIRVDIRIVAATKTDLRAAVAAGSFREDLFYRLNVIPVKLPPLRERRDDIPLLIDHFVRMYSNGRQVKFDPQAMRLLLAYDWPGNVRELENTIEGTLAVAGDADMIYPYYITNEAIHPHSPADPASGDLLDLDEYLKVCEKKHLKDVMDITDGHRSKAAELLKISRKSLWYKLKHYGLDL